MSTLASSGQQPTSPQSQPSRAITRFRPVSGLRSPREVGSQVAEIEVIEHDPGVCARCVIARSVLETGDEVHKADIVYVRQELAGGDWSVAPWPDIEADLAHGRRTRHRPSLPPVAVIRLRRPTCTSGGDQVQAHPESDLVSAGVPQQASPSDVSAALSPRVSASALTV